MFRPLLIAATLIASPAYAADPVAPTDVVATDAAAKPEKDRVVCKTQDQLGSRLRKTRVCRTRAQWADLVAQTQEKTRDYQRGGIKTE